MTSHGSVIRLVALQHFADSRGGLSVVEPERLGLFSCRRMFIVHGVPNNSVRGCHAHRACHQLMIAASGSVTIEVQDGVSTGQVRLDDPAVGVYLPPMTWGVQRDFSNDCALVVLASHDYDADDYIHDLAEFRALAAASTSK